MVADRGTFFDASGRRKLRSPIVYLDQSTLVDAFMGKHGKGSDTTLNAELASVVEDVATRGTLCLSIVHVLEIVPWPDRDDAFAMAGWLDSLDPLWFQMEGGPEDELANEVMRRLGLRTAPVGRLPIHAAMTAAVRENIKSFTREVATDFLSTPGVASLVRKLHGNPKLNDNHKNVQTYSVGLARRAHEDRSSIGDGIAPEQIAQVTGAKFSAQLQIRAWQRIATAPIEPEESYPSEADVSRAVIDALADPGAIPLSKISHHLLGQMTGGITRSDPESRSFKDRFDSFIWDMRHALAGAVVDVFTCDKYVDSVLTDFRQSRGMQRQVSMRGRDRAAFVAELRRQCA
jgi:hypothetical protein